MSPDKYRSVSLDRILADFPLKILAGQGNDTHINKVVADSRQVESGMLFVACTGKSVDGHRYIPEAIAKGAAAVVGEQPLSNLVVPYIQVENSRQALPYLAAAFYGYPARRLTMIGVTGTDGKTTTCNLIYQVLLAAGYKAGLISTVNAVIGNQILDTGLHVTTPEPSDMQRYLAMMIDAGLTHVVLESTSHGWAQYRVDACEFDIGVITNITHEHLDYHGSFENYRAAKARLLLSLGETMPKQQGNPRLSVLNRDDLSYDYLSNLVHGPQTSYGLDLSAEFHAIDIICNPSGIQFTVVGRDFRIPVKSSLIGTFNVSNCLAALTTTLGGLKINPETVVHGIAALTGIPGRMERIDLGQPFIAIVDFAHTPNALRVAIETARRMTDKRVITIFGSAGSRDREKRFLMAKVSTELADMTILTAEDPRTDSLDDILEEMAAGANASGGREGKTFWRIPDRRTAIRLGIKMAAAGDIVIACGKGHEQSMCIGLTEYPWDDRIAIRSALAELMKVKGLPMPYLPTEEK